MFLKLCLLLRTGRTLNAASCNDPFSAFAFLVFLMALLDMLMDMGMDMAAMADATAGTKRSSRSKRDDRMKVGKRFRLNLSNSKQMNC